MTLRFMVVEDMGMRMRALEAVCCAARSPSGEPFAAVARGDWMMSAPEVAAALDPVALASVDGVFVDFDLQAYKTPGYLSWEPFVLASGARFVPRTGMSVLLLLRELMETAEYELARRKHVSSLPADQREWLGRSGATRLFSFVEAKDPVSQLFMASTALWFGTTYYNAQPDVLRPGEFEAAIKALRQGDRYAKRYNTLVPQAFDALMSTDFRGMPPNQSLMPDPHPWRTNFEMFCIYLKHRGKRGFGPVADPVGYREAVLAVTGIRLEPRRANVESEAKVFQRMQAALATFHATTDMNPSSWPSWDKLSQPQDPMLEYLQASQLFWSSADVRVAHHEHLRRTEQSR